MFVMGQSTFLTLWRLIDGNQNLQSSVIIGLEKNIDRTRSRKGIEIQCWKGDKIKNKRVTKTENHHPSAVPGIANVLGRGRSIGPDKSNREKKFKKRNIILTQQTYTYVGNDDQVPFFLLVGDPELSRDTKVQCFLLASPIPVPFILFISTAFLYIFCTKFLKILQY